MGEEERADHGLRERLAAAGEEAIGDVTQALVDNPVLNQAVAAALGAGERALEAQRAAMSALNVPSADDIDRVERRVRGLSARVEELEDRLDEVVDELVALRKQAAGRKPASASRKRRAAADPED